MFGPYLAQFMFLQDDEVREVDDMIEDRLSPSSIRRSVSPDRIRYRERDRQKDRIRYRERDRQKDRIRYRERDRQRYRDSFTI